MSPGCTRNALAAGKCDGAVDRSCAEELVEGERSGNKDCDGYEQGKAARYDA